MIDIYSQRKWESRRIQLENMLEYSFAKLWNCPKCGYSCPSYTKNRYEPEYKRCIVNCHDCGFQSLVDNYKIPIPCYEQVKK